MSIELQKIEPYVNIPAKIRRYPNDSIVFHVGPHEYTLVITDRRIYNERGEELEGMAVERRRLLILSYLVELERREEIALHELAHAHLFHHARPRTDEERSQFFALCAKQYRIDMERQGSEEAIIKLRPQFVPHIASPVQDVSWDDTLVDC